MPVYQVLTIGKVTPVSVARVCLVSGLAVRRKAAAVKMVNLVVAMANAVTASATMANAVNRKFHGFAVPLYWWTYKETGLH